MAIFIFNVPARTMKRERFALAGVPLLTSNKRIFVTNKFQLTHRIEVMKEKLS